jgi:hypothetical protein
LIKRRSHTKPTEQPGTKLLQNSFVVLEYH